MTSPVQPISVQLGPTPAHPEPKPATSNTAIVRTRRETLTTEV